jgi:hypothetical protein
MDAPMGNAALKDRLDGVPLRIWRLKQPRRLHDRAGTVALEPFHIVTSVPFRDGFHRARTRATRWTDRTVTLSSSTSAIRLTELALTSSDSTHVYVKAKMNLNVKDGRVNLRALGKVDVADESTATGLPDALPADPKLLMFVVQLALNAGNASEAARSIGWSASQGRMLTHRYPGLRDLARSAVDAAAHTTVRRWVDMHAKALRTIDDLMTNAEDERTRLHAALAVVERVEGRVPQKVELDEPDPRDVFASTTVRFATAYHLLRGVELADAMLYAEKHPEVVEAWAKRHGLVFAARVD